jgi:hypothetical protein
MSAQKNSGEAKRKKLQAKMETSDHDKLLDHVLDEG